MDSYLALHQKRMNNNGYNTRSREIQTNTTKNFIDVSFTASPLYTVADIEGVKYDVRVWEDKINKGTDFFEQKQLLFRPNTYVESGSYVRLENFATGEQETWLILYYKADVFTPKAYIRKCTKVIEYKETAYPCVISNNVSSSSEIVSNGQLLLPRGHKLVYIKSTQDTMKMEEKERFIIDGDTYEVQTIEKTINTENGIGFIVLTMKQVPKNHKEQLEVGIDTKEEIVVDKDNIQTVDNLWGEW